MQKHDAYSILGWLAMVSVPIAPAFFFGHAMYTAAFNLTRSDWLSITVGVVSAAGLELVGILSGHAAVKFWRLGDDIKAAICGVILVAYVLLGISGLQGWLVKGVVMFLIAPLVYLLVALQESAGVAENTQETAENRKLAQEADEAEFKRKVKLAEMRLKHEERIARIQAKTVSNERSESGQKTVTYSSDWRLLPDSEKARMTDLTSGEIATKYNVSDSTARRWLRNARELTAQVNGNGHVQ